MKYLALAFAIISVVSCALPSSGVFIFTEFTTDQCTLRKVGQEVVAFSVTEPCIPDSNVLSTKLTDYNSSTNVLTGSTYGTANCSGEGEEGTITCNGSCQEIFTDRYFTCSYYNAESFAITYAEYENSNCSDSTGYSASYSGTDLCIADTESNLSISPRNIDIADETMSFFYYSTSETCQGTPSTRTVTCDNTCNENLSVDGLYYKCTFTADLSSYSSTLSIFTLALLALLF
jgi:hypothetical protein